MEQPTVSPGQTRVGHHRPQGFVARRFRVIVPRLVKNMFDRFVIGDPEYVLLLGGQAHQATRIGRSIVPPKQLWHGQRHHIADGTRPRSPHSPREVTPCYGLAYVILVGNPGVDKAIDVPSKNVFGSGPGTSDIEIREYLRYNAYRPQAAAKAGRT